MRDLVCIFDRRAGKTLASTVFDGWIARACDHSDVLVPGESGIALISSDQRAAKVTLDYLEGIFNASEVLCTMVANRTADSLELTNLIKIECGRRIACPRAVRPASASSLKKSDIGFVD